MSALTGPGNKPQTSHADSDVVTTEQTGRYIINLAKQSRPMCINTVKGMLIGDGNAIIIPWA